MASTKPSIDVVIPAYNEEASLPLVLEAIPSPPVSRTVVVDNNSTDATSEVAAAGGAEVVTERRPGYGSACLGGLDYLRRHDQAQRRIMETVEMPDRRVQDLIMFIRQNDGTLAKRRREKEFAALTDDEVASIEEIYRDAFAGENT